MDKKKAEAYSGIYKVYGQSFGKIMIVASIIMMISVSIIGMLSFWITEKEILHKLKTKDLEYIAESIASKINGRIDRAKETSLHLARDPSLVEWVEDGERDAELSRFAKQKLISLARDYDYTNAFIVSAITKHYWAENGQIIETMSKDNPNHRWFFDRLKQNVPVTVVFDYNDARDDTFVFLNALLGDMDHPSAVVGVGLSMKDISLELEKLKYGEGSHLRVIDQSGNIYISDKLMERGGNIQDYYPMKVKEELLDHMGSQSNFVTEYKNREGHLVDLISFPVQSAGWMLVVDVPRKDTVAFLDTIKLNTVLATLLLLLFSILLFYMVTKYLANPYKKALELNEELEKKISERTNELRRKNQTLLDGIDYAKRIQESILPSTEQLNRVFRDCFLLWRPRDAVGGDFYWIKESEDGFFIGIGDCTGHGVPGACMTMMVLSILDHITNESTKNDPGLVLRLLNQKIKETLRQDEQEALTDDGLDMGLCYVNKAEQKLIYSGARIGLYFREADELQQVKGNKKSIGYRRTPIDHAYENTVIEYREYQTFFMTTDGYIDQDGGKNDFSLGRKKFEEILARSVSGSDSLAVVRMKMDRELENFMGENPQRDDITLIAFRL